MTYTWNDFLKNKNIFNFFWRFQNWHSGKNVFFEVNLILCVNCGFISFFYAFVLYVFVAWYTDLSWKRQLDLSDVTSLHSVQDWPTSSLLIGQFLSSCQMRALAASLIWQDKRRRQGKTSLIPAPLTLESLMNLSAVLLQEWTTLRLECIPKNEPVAVSWLRYDSHF